ncbi:discoidin domain-containing protein [Kiritimatiella glycovorans]|nr:discoidin domain-containing protein [Kiritimatiella glycovorans]
MTAAVAAGRAETPAAPQARTTDAPDQTVAIVLADHPSPAEQIAAAHLEQTLTALYPSANFTVSSADAGAGALIFVGTPDSLPTVRDWVGTGTLEGEEDFVIRHASRGGRQAGLIAGKTGRAVLHGAYRLTEALGCGHYITETTMPAPREVFTFEGWDMEDHPLVRERIVFNWHNFLSGCSGWDEEHWLEWIEQSQKMGYNAIMVHAYGNNPMFTYTFRGMEKEVGYTVTTRRGREWSNQHVNDIRRLPGGPIFDRAEFGSETALVSGERRIEAKQRLMQTVFTEAERRQMRVTFALDVDTGSVLPQEMITALDADERFRNGHIWLPRPDTPGGYEFYRAQVRGLLELYPQIDRIALYQRPNGAHWGLLKKVDQLPEPWRAEYREHVREHPDAAGLEQSIGAFALSKVCAAFRRALDEMGREDIRLGYGSWHTKWMPAVVEFFPEEVDLMPLDCTNTPGNKSFFDRDDSRADLMQARGRIIPIIWAHHDGQGYIGRPFLPHDDLLQPLSDLEADGFAVLHWMNRPMDLYFKNQINQVWSLRRSEPLAHTCRVMARHFFGPSHEENLGEYLLRWIHDAPSLGRVTRDHFFLLSQNRIREPEAKIRACRERLERLRSVDTSDMNPRQKERLDYFKTLEQVIIGFCENQALAYRPAYGAIRGGDYSRARALLRRADPARTIERYAELSQIGKADRGEKALVPSLGTRWMTDFIAARQAAGMETVRIHYGPTRHEDLAMDPGSYTYHIDTGGRYWSVRGEREVSHPVMTLASGTRLDPAAADAAPDAAILRSGICIDESAALAVSPMVALFEELAPGAYRVRAWLSAADGSARCRLGINALVSAPHVDTVRIEPVRARLLRVECHSYEADNWNSIYEIRSDAIDRAAPGGAAASTHTPGYPPEAVLDHDPTTRWAAQGEQWIQVPLDPGEPLESVKIAWYKGESRNYRYTLKVSDDGEQWREVTRLPDSVADAGENIGPAREVRLDRPADGSRTVTAADLPVRLDHPSKLRLRVDPLDGAVLLHALTCSPERE